MHFAGIRNACYLVRHYQRGRFARFQREQRRAAIAQLGRAALAALAQCRTPEDFETVLTVLLDGLAPPERRF